MSPCLDDRRVITRAHKHSYLNKKATENRKGAKVEANSAVIDDVCVENHFKKSRKIIETYIDRF